MPHQDKYQDFTAREFLCDEYFQEWILRPNAESDVFFQNLAQVYPDKKKALEEAGMLLLNLRFRRDQPPSGRAEESLAKAWETIEVLEESPAGKKGIVRGLRGVWKYAAVWLLVSGISVAVYFWANRSGVGEVATRFGQVDSLLLPDKSMVVLNANSTLRYDKRWREGAPREVWLKGEALFHILHLDEDENIAPEERFLVHVGNITVEVLGTSFNIRQRREKIEVSLLSGAVRVKFEGQNKPDVLLQPGELISINTSLGNVVKESAAAENHSAWTRNRLVLNNPTLQEIADYLEDIYGKEIRLMDPELAGRKVEGPILLDSMDDALFVLSTVLNVSIVKENDAIIIRPK